MEERQAIRKYECKLRFLSAFYLFFAIFILLNACIGFSSSPYFERYTTCQQYHVTPECVSLRRRVDVIYSCEMAGSLVLVAHGMLGLILLENMKSIRWAQALQYYSRVAIPVYITIIIMRISFYIKIVPMLQPEYSWE